MVKRTPLQINEARAEADARLAARVQARLKTEANLEAKRIETQAYFEPVDRRVRELYAIDVALSYARRSRSWREYLGTLETKLFDALHKC